MTLSKIVLSDSTLAQSRPRLMRKLGSSVDYVHDENFNKLHNITFCYT